jgi:hypothetical protein
MIDLHQSQLTVDEAIEKVRSWDDSWGPKKTAVVLVDEIRRLRQKAWDLHGSLCIRDFHTFRD